MAESYRVDSTRSNADTNQLYWPVADQGFVASTLVAHPIMVWPRNVDAVPAWVLDGDYPMLACPSFRDYHVVTDSDELFGFELSPPDKAIGVPDRPRRFSVFRHAVQALHSYNRLHRRLAREIIRIHIGDLDARWDVVVAQARRTVHAMRLLVVSARRRHHYPDLFQKGSSHDFNRVRRVAIFGAGAAGLLARALADRCGWEVSRWVDNDRARWGEQIDGAAIGNPAELRRQDFDVVLVASGPGKWQIFDQLEEMGLRYGRDFVYFRDPILVRGVQIALVG
jgi:hypothetical protein